MKKHYITPNRKWVGFVSDDSERNYTRAVYDMYNDFDRIGEGVLCIIEVQNDTGELVLSFDKRSLRFLNEYKIDVEKWLDTAYNSILNWDVFRVLDDDGKIATINDETEFVLIDDTESINKFEGTK